ncbi:MAG: signal peptidase II [Syntrophothermus sp.]
MRVLFLTLFVVLADQISKLLVKGISLPFLNIRIEGFNYAEQHNIIGSFLRLTFVENPGMAFGIDLGLASKLFLSIFSVAASGAILVYLYKMRSAKPLLRIALALLLAGALGNLIDRVFYGVIFGYAPLFFGRVVDFIELNLYPLNLFGYTVDRFPIFNIADVAVTSGVILLLMSSIREEREKLPSVPGETPGPQGTDL